MYTFLFRRNVCEHDNRIAADLLLIEQEPERFHVVKGLKNADLIGERFRHYGLNSFGKKADKVERLINFYKNDPFSFSLDTAYADGSGSDINDDHVDSESMDVIEEHG